VKPNTNLFYGRKACSDIFRNITPDQEGSAWGTFEEMKPSPEPSQAHVTKPTFAFAIATACGAGYLPNAPGTFGSLVGCLLTVGLFSGGVSFSFSQLSRGFLTIGETTR
jgi:hypothetical protein